MRITATKTVTTTKPIKTEEDVDPLEEFAFPFESSRESGFEFELVIPKSDQSFEARPDSANKSLNIKSFG